ncbi:MULTISPECIES: HAD family acid phosphatase [Streptomyces]|uniref:Acid phosphatase n=1 Tax=Streptomyces albus (strain ATCC 21838 / DSM 41398 / FERM P-419 / JCM 4703 / NBRC 107858) TaxID=1081613 RepID=A0A0B5EYP5_STRA4|nr:HAD family acid phosphatase [Streptomyces sp. SCSIO ZS0520]AJE83771.1 hypothetical protein SLNWT_3395 [Streptomyces albus]AOU78077.1 hypothetical protein SLNHY_3386 [Streptomyces albus]AYN33833.1 hypothetical protein DUI70_3331 [Streptomyces albus]
MRKRVIRGIGALAAASATVALATGAASALPTQEEWLADVDARVAPAQEYLADRLPADEKTTLVLDIDNTTMQTHYERGKAIPSMLALVEEAKKQGSAVSFVTARDNDSREATIDELRSAGYPVDNLCMVGDVDGSSTAEIKTNCRIRLEGEGYTITANIGNHTHDLEGGHSERTYDLPDYGELS